MENRKKTLFRRLLCAVSVAALAVACLFTGCTPQYYTEEDVRKLTEEGTEAIEKWLAENEPGAKATDITVLKALGFLDEGHGLSDALEFTVVSGDTVSKRIFVTGTGRMYRDDLHELCTATVAKVLAENLGFGGNNAVLNGSAILEIPARELEDRKENGKFEIYNRTGMGFEMLPYEVTEENLEEFVRSAVKSGELTVLRLNLTIELSEEDGPEVTNELLEGIRKLRELNRIGFVSADRTKETAFCFTTRDNISGQTGEYIQLIEYERTELVQSEDPQFTATPAEVTLRQMWVGFYDLKTLALSSEGPGADAK